MKMPSLADIHAARARLAGRVHVTPMLSSSTFAAQSGAAAFLLKCESFQKTGSFKVRGALNAISQLDASARARGVVTVSAGNHAQAVAWAASAEGIPSTVVMPATASKTKAAASAAYGAEVILHGTGAEAFAKAQEIALERGLEFVHPFDDPRILAGAASCGLEILEQAPDVDIVVVPIGGGGLIAGITSGIKQTNPRVRIVGVEPDGADSMVRSLKAGHAVRLDAPPNTFADGLAAPMAGELCFDVVRQFVDEVVLVSDDEIAAAMSMLLTRAKILAEGGGAAATAALLTKKIAGVAGKRIVSIVSGGNIDLEKLKQRI